MFKSKIAHLTSVHPPFDNRIFFKECKSLAEAGADVVLIAVHERDELVEGVRIRAVASAGNRLQRMLRTVWRIYRTALAEDAAVCHLHDPELLLIAPFLRLRGKRVIFDMHENTPKSLLTKGWIPGPLRPLLAAAFRLAERLLLRGVPVIFAERSYRRDYPWVSTAAEVLNLPRVDDLVRLQAPAYPTPTVGYIGAVSPVRGSLITLEALHLLQKQGCPVHFECVGLRRESDRQAMTELVEAYGLEGVSLRPYMKPAEGWAHIARCHAGLAILKPIPNYLESYPTKMFEYMALGLPVITSHFPLYREVVEGAGCGLLVDPEDPEAIAAAIRWIVEHPAEAAEMGRRGREAVSARYSWSFEAQKLLRFYQQILAQ